MDEEGFVSTISSLDLTEESEHFLLRYGLRNPRDGKGLGSDGVSDLGLISSYLDSLERLYQTMRRPPWSRPAPKVGSNGKTIVYICDIEYPFTGVFGAEGVPYIALPSRSREPMNDGAQRRAAAEAVHEATHVFNFTERPFYDTWTGWWTWFDEALAVYLEGQILPGNRDYFRYLADWVDQPGIPLNDGAAQYQASFFIKFLTARAVKLGAAFPNQVWTESFPKEKPLEALQRLLGSRGLVFSSADPNQTDLFASGYAMDSYFLRDPTSGCFSPELHARYGERALAQSRPLAPGGTITFEGNLPHLACKYFRIHVHRVVDRARVALLPGAGTMTELRAEVTIASRDFRRGQVSVLRPVKGVNQNGLRGATLKDLASQDMDHIVLVVTNCHVEELHYGLIPAYGGESFRIEISAV